MFIRPLTAAITLLLAFHSAYGIPLRVLAWDETVVGRKLGLQHSKGTEELKDLHPLSRSEIFDVKASEETPPRIVALDRLDDKGQPLADGIRLPANSKNPLLLLIPDPKAATGIRIMVVEDNIAGFNWGTVRLVNVTGKKLLFKYDENVSALPESWKPVDVRPGGSSRNVQVLMALADNPDELLYSAIWEHKDTERRLVFVIPNQGQGQGPVSFKFIIESQLDAKASALQSSPEP